MTSPRLLLSTGIALISLGCAAWGGEAPAAKPESVDLGTFTTQLEAWNFAAGSEYPGATGALTRVDTEGHTAPGAARLSGDFSAGGRYVGMRMKKVDVLASEFSFWVKPDGIQKSLMVRLTDEGDQTFVYRLPLAAGKDWQRLAIVLKTAVPESWFAGAKDGKWKGQIATIVIGLTKEACIDGKVGACLVDDVTLTKAKP